MLLLPVQAPALRATAPGKPRLGRGPLSAGQPEPLEKVPPRLRSMGPASPRGCTQGDRHTSQRAMTPRGMDASWAGENTDIIEKVPTGPK